MRTGKLFCLLSLAQCGAWAWPSGYSSFFTLTINPGQVPSAQSNYTLYFAGQAALAGTGSGGCATSANGYDIIFAADPGGVSLYPFDLVAGTYNSATGAGEWHIGPLPSISSGTVLYVACGNAGVASFQGGTSGAAWDSSFETVNHFGTPSTLGLVDATANPLTATNSGVAAGTGKLSGGAYFAGSQYYILGNAPKTNNWTQQTVSFWANISSSISMYGRIVEKGANNEWTITGSAPGVPGVVSVQVEGGSANCASTPWMFSDAWHKFDVTMNHTTRAMAIFVDGSLLASCTSSTSATVMTHDIYVGRYGGGSYNFLGSLDELSISNVVRSADWIQTQYKNESAPATFYTLAAVYGSSAQIHHKVSNQ